MDRSVLGIFRSLPILVCGQPSEAAEPPGVAVEAAAKLFDAIDEIEKFISLIISNLRKSASVA